MVQELDEYILKAFKGGKEVSKFLDTSQVYLEHNFGKA